MITVLMWSLSLYHSEKDGYIQLSSTEEEFISTNSLDTYFVPHRAILLISQKHVSMGHQQSYQLRTEYPFGNKDKWLLGLLTVVSPHTDLPTEERRHSWHSKNECQGGIQKYAHLLTFRATYLWLLQKKMVRLINWRQRLNAIWCKS